MAKAKKSVFFCQNCGHEESKWLGQCPMCKEWNSFVEECVTTSNTAAVKAAKEIRIVPLSEVKTENEKIVLTQTLLEEAGAEVVAVQGERMPVISFMVPGYSAEEAGDILSMADDIHLRTGLHCAPLVFAGLPGLAHKETIRISLSRFTTEAEIRELAQAVQAVAHVRV